MSAALRQLSDQSGVRILFPYDAVAPIRSRRVEGWLTTQDALEQLLAGTSLKHRETGQGVIALSAPAERSGSLRSPIALHMIEHPLNQMPLTLGPGDEVERFSTPIIVTGTRQTTRTVAQSLAPIDVLGEKDMEASGKQSVRNLLATLVPSINISNSGAGASFAVKTLSLRGLAGDHLLLLVNGKRRHNSATRQATPLNLRATRYGRITQIDASAAGPDAVIHPKIIVDIEGGVDLAKGVKLAVGANNLFNIYPDRLPVALRGNDFSLYNQYSPYGTSGGLYYARLSLSF